MILAAVTVIDGCPFLFLYLLYDYVFSALGCYTAEFIRTEIKLDHTPDLGMRVYGSGLLKAYFSHIVLNLMIYHDLFGVQIVGARLTIELYMHIVGLSEAVFACRDKRILYRIEKHIPADVLFLLQHSDGFHHFQRGTAAHITVIYLLFPCGHFKPSSCIVLTKFKLILRHFVRCLHLPRP